MNAHARALASPNDEALPATMAMASPLALNGSSIALPSTGDHVDLHELAKGWKAAIARAKDPATRYGG